MDGDSGKRLKRIGHWWLATLVILIGLPVGLVTARQAMFDPQSPATGHAQVTTQGISKLPEGQVVWRVVERTARPRGVAVNGERPLGFILATEEPILLTNVSSSGKQVDVARLGPGESYLVKQGTHQIRASLSDHEVKFISIELVSAADAEKTNGGTLLFTSAAFTAPAGERDIDLVRNVLVSGERATLPDTGASVAILATEGSIDILPSGGSGKKLDAGNGALFAPGDLQIAPATPSASAVGPRAQFSSITSSLQQGDGSRAAYVVAVIGAEIPPFTPSPTATATATATATPTDTPILTETPLPTDTPQALGAIVATVHDCPPGMTVENLAPGQCGLSAGGYQLNLAGPDTTRTLDDAVDLGGSWQWGDLPLVTYRLTETLPPGYDDYFVPGSAAVGGSSADGYTITIDGSAPNIGVDVYNFQPAPQAGSITIELHLCPQGQVPNDFNPNDCTLATGGYSYTLTAASTGASYSMKDASVDGGTATWSELPLDSYTVTVDSLPRGWTQVLWPDGGVTNVGDGETVQIDGNAPSAYVVLYAFQSQTTAG